jgi:hypothetical protein
MYGQADVTRTFSGKGLSPPKSFSAALFKIAMAYFEKCDAAFTARYSESVLERSGFDYILIHKNILSFSPIIC